MSQRIFRTTARDGLEVEVLLGHDRPLGHLFLVVTPAGEPDADPIYSNLNDPYAGISLRSLDHYREVLAKMGVAVPERIFEAVLADQAADAGNLVVEYGADGEPL